MKNTARPPNISERSKLMISAKPVGARHAEAREPDEYENLSRRAVQMTPVLESILDRSRRPVRWGINE